MRPTIYIPDTLSAGAREAISDMLTSSIEVPYLLDAEVHGDDASADVGSELARAGYLTIDGTVATWHIDVAPPTASPSDAAQGAHDAVEALGAVVTNTTRDHLPAAQMEAVGIDSSLHGYAVAVATRSVLQLALHAANGRLAPEAVATHFTYAAANLARAITRGRTTTDAT